MLTELLDKIRLFHIIFQQPQSNFYGDPGSNIAAEMFGASMPVGHHGNGKMIADVNTGTILTYDSFFDMTVSDYRGMYSLKHSTSPRQIRCPCLPDP